MRITGLANNLRTLADDVPDVMVVRKMLEVVPEHLEQITISLETLLDLNTVSVEEVTGRLRAVVDSQGRLLLTQEEWMAKLKIGGGSGEKGSSSGSNSTGGGGGNRRSGATRGRGRGNDGTR